MEFPEVNATILAIVIGLTEMVKGLGVNGKSSLVFALLAGLLLGAGYQLSATSTPVDFAGWFTVLVAGLIHGLAPSGLYNVAKRFTTQ